MSRAGAADARLGAMKKLFAHLNYEATRNPLPAKLPADVQSQLATLPSVVATGADDRSFLIIHVQLASDGLSRTTERAVVGALLKHYPYALFVFSNRDHSRWHLLNVKVARKEVTDENRDAKLRRLYRRISIAPEDRLRTATERVEKLDLATINPELFGLSPLAIQEAHDDAFDVEAVTKQFFQDYKRVFDYVEGAITGLRGPDKRRLFTQRLFNRLMFIAFIQKKEWLKFPGMEENEYLEALWRDYQAKKKDDSNFYTDRLAHLFFRGLNNPSHVDLLATNRGHSAPDSFLQRRIGDVPYLNGGLFEKSDDGTDEADAGIVIPDKAVNAILHELFARFNFTVTESTPLDVEVAVDPEMLGKVFEELVTGRHESGSYYTPKPIVSFMCREALKGFLETNCPKEKAEAVSRFVDEHDASALHDGEAVLEALKAVKCCDPACGSGAYLLGLMHELLELRQTLFKTDRKLDSISSYQRKLEIIQTNVYGVDLDTFAVNIARLRLWLSLAVDFEGGAPPPLPNLDFKIEAGDSLAAPDPSGSGQLQLQKPLVDEFLSLKRRYLLAHGTDKKDLKRQIERLRERIQAWTHKSGALPENAFDWQVEFAEVFIDGGFHIVLANPPYVKSGEIGPEKARLRQVYASAVDGTSDLYCSFYVRGVQLLSQDGTHVFVCSNSWLDVQYGTLLQTWLTRHTSINAIYDSAVERQFSTAEINTIISVMRRVPMRPEDEATFVTYLAPFEVASVDESKQRRRAVRFDELISADAGSDRTARRSSGKWGSRFFRASDISVVVMERARSLLTPLHALADVRPGCYAGINDFFYLTDDVVSEFEIEDRFVMPFIRSSRDVERLRLDGNFDSGLLFYCPLSLDELRRGGFKGALAYIRWGERQVTRQRQKTAAGIPWPEVETVRRRKPGWWAMPEANVKPARNFLLYVIGQRFLSPWSSSPRASDRCFHRVIVPDKLVAPVAVSLNLATTLLMISSQGRVNLGQGAHKFETADAKQLLVFNPTELARRIDVSSAVAALGGHDVLPIAQELELPERRKVDDAVFDELSLSKGERDAVYEAVIGAVTNRNRKAKTIA